jgi:hypothetical protein
MRVVPSVTRLLWYSAVGRLRRDRRLQHLQAREVVDLLTRRDPACDGPLVLGAGPAEATTQRWSRSRAPILPGTRIVCTAR